MQLTQKERDLLKDLKEQENLCAEKYAKHSCSATDPQLRNLFSRISGVEKQHCETITQIEGGAVPSPGGGTQSQPTFSSTYGAADSPDKKNDRYLCADVLAAEKHASHLYDVCVYEFCDENVRNALDHIQKEEHGHGKMIYDYMKANSMY